MKRFLFIPMLLICSVCYASEITSITGTLVDNEELTISGSDLGTKSPAAPIIWDDFNTGSDGDLLTAHGWTKYASGVDGGALEADNSYGGSGLSAWNDIIDVDWHYQFNTSYQTFTDTDTLYISYMQRYDITGSTDGSMKFVRMNDDGDVYSSPTKMEFEYDVGGWLRSYVRYDSTEGNFYTDSASVSPSNNDWFRVEMYKKLSSPAGTDNGSYWTSIDNAIQVNQTSVVTLDTGETASHSSVLLGLMFANPTATTLTVQNDDLYVDNTAIRVELSQNIDGTGHSEIQIPHHWSETDIGITVNQGTFTAGTKVYIIVYDADNAIIATFETEIGETGTPPEDPTPPSSGNSKLRISGSLKWQG